MTRLTCQIWLMQAVVPSVSCPLCVRGTPLLQPETDSHIAKHLHSFTLQTLSWGNIGPDDDAQIYVDSDIKKTAPLDGNDELADEKSIGTWVTIFLM